MARIVWLEREKCLTMTISERLEKFYEVALEAVEKPEAAPVTRARSVAFAKGKLLMWKSRLI